MIDDSFRIYQIFTKFDRNVNFIPKKLLYLIYCIERGASDDFTSLDPSYATMAAM